jgi:hypothetical protein
VVGLRLRAEAIPLTAPGDRADRDLRNASSLTSGRVLVRTILLRDDRRVTLTFEFPMRDDRDNVRAELTRQGFATSTPLARIADENYLEVAGVTDQRQAERVEQIVHRVSRASRRVPNDEASDS